MISCEPGSTIDSSAIRRTAVTFQPNRRARPEQTPAMIRSPRGRTRAGVEVVVVMSPASPASRTDTRGLAPGADEEDAVDQQVPGLGDRGAAQLGEIHLEQLGDRDDDRPKAQLAIARADDGRQFRADAQLAAES